MLVKVGAKAVKVRIGLACVFRPPTCKTGRFVVDEYAPKLNAGLSKSRNLVECVDPFMFHGGNVGPPVKTAMVCIVNAYSGKRERLYFI